MDSVLTSSLVLVVLTISRLFPAPRISRSEGLPAYLLHPKCNKEGIGHLFSGKT